VNLHSDEGTRLAKVPYFLSRARSNLRELHTVLTSFRYLVCGKVAPKNPGLPKYSAAMVCCSLTPGL